MAKTDWTDTERIALLHHVHDGRLSVDAAADLLLCGTPEDVVKALADAATA